MTLSILWLGTTAGPRGGPSGLLGGQSGPLGGPSVRTLEPRSTLFPSVVSLGPGPAKVPLGESLLGPGLLGRSLLGQSPLGQSLIGRIPRVSSPVVPALPKYNSVIPRT